MYYSFYLFYTPIQIHNLYSCKILVKYLYNIVFFILLQFDYLTCFIMFDVLHICVVNIILPKSIYLNYFLNFKSQLYYFILFIYIDK